MRSGCFAVFGADDTESGTQRLVVAAEVRNGNRRGLQELIEDIRSEVMTSVGVAVGDVLLLESGSMTKTSSGKRRNRFYKKLYEEGSLESLASLRDSSRS